MNEPEQRRHLAAAFRWTARLGLHEGVANHFSALVPGSDTQFLLNPRGAHFSRITASSLLSLDAAAAGGVAHPDADPTAWFLHAQLHRLVPHAKVILHTHMPYATSLACLQDFELQMLDQSSCRFFGRVAYDRSFGGMFLDDSEGPRLAGLLADGVSTVFLGSHGVMVVGNTVAEAFGVWKLKKNYGKEYMGIERSAFLIGTDGKLEHTWYKISPKDTPLNLLQALGA